MSEIKGQILGIILSIGVFTVVFGALCGAFKNTSANVEQKMQTALSSTYNDATGGVDTTPYVAPED